MNTVYVFLDHNFYIRKFYVLPLHLYENRFLSFLFLTKHAEVLIVFQQLGPGARAHKAFSESLNDTC